MNILKLAFALSALSFCGSAFAAVPDASVTKRAIIYSAEGTKIGRVETLVPAAGGQSGSVRVIYRGKFITLPISTLSEGPKGFKTSFTADQLKKM